MREEAALLAALHSTFELHPGQLEIARAVFVDGIKFVFVQAGRKFGKTDLGLYLAYRYALTHPKSANYYIAPQYKQAKEILWASKRVQDFVARELIRGEPNNQETRVTLINDAFIKLEGSEDPNPLRGMTMDFVLLDEYREHNREILEVVRPNLAPRNGVLVIIGTPPPEGVLGDGRIHHYVREQREAEEFMKRGKAFYFHAPTHVNPHISREWLEDEHERLVARGEEYVWEREYLARYVSGGANVIFPMFERNRGNKAAAKHVWAHADLVDYIAKDRSKLEYYLVADPGSTTCFCVLFIAYNPYTAEVCVLDEIYEKDPLKTSVQRIWPRCVGMMEDIYLPPEGVLTSRTWKKLHDSAAAWYELELQSQFGIASAGCDKSKFTKEEGLSIWKDMMLDGLYKVSTRCVNHIWELTNYRTDEHGRLTKKNDHSLDAFRYFLQYSNYSYRKKRAVEPLDAIDEFFLGERRGQRGMSVFDWAKVLDEY